MTDERSVGRGSVAAGAPTGKAGARQDASGRAYAGSQMNLQVWVNRRQQKISADILEALGIPASAARLEWTSPLENVDVGRKKGFAEYRDGAFLRALGLGERQHREALKNFWPKGGPVWDGLARIIRPGSDAVGYVLVEAKSYPREVYGGGCKATADSDQRTLIADSLDAASTWLGLSERPASWMGKLYESANRIAHVYLLRERLGLEAYMVNVCFTGDPRTPTSEEQWVTAHGAFAEQLKTTDVVTPWLVDIYLSAVSHSDSVATSEGNA